MSLRYGQVRIELECAVEQRLARQAHNLEVVGSIPTGATSVDRASSPSSKSREELSQSADAVRMDELNASDVGTLTHHLVLPRDANHHGTLYAGVLLSLALEA